jgi:hypothetical protein
LRPVSHIYTRKVPLIRLKMDSFKDFHGCCGRGLPRDDLRQCLRNNLLCETYSHQVHNNQIISELQRYHITKNNEKVKFVKKPQMFGHTFCWNCFSFIFAVSASSMKRRKRHVREGKGTWTRKEGTGKQRPHSKAGNVLDFLSQLERIEGERWPDRFKVELPPSSKFHHWLAYLKECEEKAKKEYCCEYSYFTAIWSQGYSHMIVPKNPRWVTWICHSHSPIV